MLRPKRATKLRILCLLLVSRVQLRLSGLTHVLDSLGVDLDGSWNHLLEVLVGPVVLLFFFSHGRIGPFVVLLHSDCSGVYVGLYIAFLRALLGNKWQLLYKLLFRTISTNNPLHVGNALCYFSSLNDPSWFDFPACCEVERVSVVEVDLWLASVPENCRRSRTKKINSSDACRPSLLHLEKIERLVVSLVGVHGGYQRLRSERFMMRLVFLMDFAVADRIVPGLSQARANVNIAIDRNCRWLRMACCLSLLELNCLCGLILRRYHYRSRRFPNAERNQWLLI